MGVCVPVLRGAFSNAAAQYISRFCEHQSPSLLRACASRRAPRFVVRADSIRRRKLRTLSTKIPEEEERTTTFVFEQTVVVEAGLDWRGMQSTKSYMFISGKWNLLFNIYGHCSKKGISYNQNTIMTLYTINIIKCTKRSRSPLRTVGS